MANDMEKKKKLVCPLLKDPGAYVPDTIDLGANESARQYWLTCLEGMVKKFVTKASSLNPDFPAAEKEAENCYQEFRKLVEKIRSDPMVLEPLTVRTLLDFNEDLLRTHHFDDAWQLQKECETSQALKDFNERLNEIDSISKFDEKWQELVTGALAGNVFDWGSTVVSSMLETSTCFGLSQALNTIEQRPWFQDNLDFWIKELKRRPYKSVVIFVDNAGVDFVLGILPLVREFLSRSTRVILTANSLPSLNDITYNELNMYCCRAAEVCDIIKGAIAGGLLVTAENGQRGPCLDLANISQELRDLIIDSDLIILEGMGRAVHTNLYAKFSVDSIKMAVLKNEWLAKSLGAKQFSVIFNYEPAS